MHLLRDQKAPPRCEVGGEKLRVDDAREDCRNIKQKERKHVELRGLAQRAMGLGVARARSLSGCPCHGTGGTHHPRALSEPWHPNRAPFSTGNFPCSAVLWVPTLHTQSRAG